jgi:hypothetical protein
MTMLDDGVLADLFSEAALSFDAPEGGAQAILERAQRGNADIDAAPDDDTTAAEDLPDELAPSRLRRATRMVRDHRVLSLAAAWVVVAAVVGGLALTGSTPPPQSALSKVHAGSTARIPAKTATGGAARLPLTPGPNAAYAGGETTGGPAGTASSGTSSSTSTFGAGGNTPAASSPLAQTATPAQSSTTPALPNNVGQSARIEQTGSLSLTVGKGALSKTMAQLSFLASAYNGFVQTSQTQSGAISASGAPSGSITLQVPVDSFANVLKKVQALGKTDALSTKATDVTGQYVDLQARIAALQQSLAQYETILAKANSIGDVLSVQTQINSIQSQIEQEQGQLQVLNNETTYSTLTVSVSEGLPPRHHRPPPPHHSGLAAAWHTSVHGFVDGVEGLIRLGGPVLFALLCALVLLVVGRVLWRRLQRHNL